MDDAVYQIKQWHGVFEDHNSRRLPKLNYVGLPVSRQSEVFTLLMESKDGLLAYGLFTGPIMRIAASCPVRGVLLDERGPYTADRVARRFNMPRKVVEVGWNLLIHESVGWLIETPADAIESAREGARKRALGTAQLRAETITTARDNPTNQPNTPTNTPDQPRADVSVGGDSQNGQPEGDIRKRAYAVLTEFGVNETAAWELACAGVKASRVNKLIPTMKNANNPPGALVDRLRKELARCPT